MAQQLNPLLSPLTIASRRDHERITPPDILGQAMRGRIDGMAAHLVSQMKAHHAAQRRTAELFEQLLCQLEETVFSFQQSFISRQLPVSQVYAQIDADRSVGILNLMWHTVSFIVRGNDKPMALKRTHGAPLFSGRIIAVLGDYRDHYGFSSESDFPAVFENELASLYIPAALDQPTVMTFLHRDDEFNFHPSEATRQFLIKILEALCGGGYYHESRVI